jgi:hypothetical protein
MDNETIADIDTLREKELRSGVGLFGCERQSGQSTLLASDKPNKLAIALDF